MLASQTLPTPLLPPTEASGGSHQPRCVFGPLDRAGATYQTVELTHDDDARTHVTDELGHQPAPMVTIEDQGTTTHWSGYRLDNLAEARHALGGTRHPPAIPVKEGQQWY